MNEVVFPSILPIKRSIEFKYIQKVEEARNKRRLLSTNIPLSFVGATCPRPDPGHSPSYVGGAMKRMGRDPGVINRKYKRKFTKFVRLWCKRNLKPLTDVDVPTVKEWLECTDYTTARKAELLREWQKHDKMPKRKILRRVKSFIKDETYPEYKYPRLINSRVDVAKCLFGPLCYAISKRLFSLPQFIKNVPVSQRPQVLRDMLHKEGENHSGTDYTSFEAHFTGERMDMTTSILFRYMVSTCGTYLKNLVEVMLKTLKGKNYIQNKICEFVIEATRCSGEMDTSLSNGFANAMNIEYLAFIKQCKVDYFVEGDDSISRWTPPEKTPTKEEFADMGWDIKVINSRELSDISFCGQVYDVDELVVVTNIVEQLCRVGWTNSRYVNSNEGTLMQLLRAKGFSLSYQYNGCPILSVLGRRILLLTEHITIERRILDNYDSYHKKILLEAMSYLPEMKTPGLNTRMLVEKLYGISIHQQLKIETDFANLQLGCHEIPFPTPKVWSEYFDRYCTNYPHYDPAWLLKTEIHFLEYIKGFSNVAQVLPL